jgi:hypothetical protein
LALSTDVSFFCRSCARVRRRPAPPARSGHGVAHRVDATLAVGRRAARLAEVQPAEQLADDDRVDAVDALGLERQRILGARPVPRRTQVRKHAHRLPQPQQSGLAPGLAGQVIPRRRAHRAEQHGICRDACIARGIGQ